MNNDLNNEDLNAEIGKLNHELDKDETKPKKQRRWVLPVVMLGAGGFIGGLVGAAPTDEPTANPVAQPTATATVTAEADTGALEAARSDYRSEQAKVQELEKKLAAEKAKAPEVVTEEVQVEIEVVPQACIDYIDVSEYAFTLAGMAVKAAADLDSDTLEQINAEFDVITPEMLDTKAACRAEAGEGA